jgi:hypothetical protein
MFYHCANTAGKINNGFPGLGLNLGFLFYFHLFYQTLPLSCNDWHDDIQHNDTQHKGLICDNQHK